MGKIPAMKRLFVRIGLALLVILVLIQLIPVNRTNPPVTVDIPTSPEVKDILRRACYDCHSNETVYPWYSRIAPVSWMLARHVSEGREELNYSTWDQYNAEDQGEKIHESWETVKEGEMPPWYYTVMHRDALLSPEDRAVLQTWAGKVERLDRDHDEENDQDKKLKNDG
jgi:hypothetical protein